MNITTADLFQPTSLAVDFNDLPERHAALVAAGCSVLGMTVDRKRGEYELRLWWPAGTQIAARQPSQAEFFASEGTKPPTEHKNAPTWQQGHIPASNK